MAPGLCPGRILGLFLVVFLHLNIDEVPLLAIVESKFVLLGGETLVMVEQGLNLIN